MVICTSRATRPCSTRSSTTASEPEPARMGRPARSVVRSRKVDDRVRPSGRRPPETNRPAVGASKLLDDGETEAGVTVGVALAPLPEGSEGTLTIVLRHAHAFVGD